MSLDVLKQEGTGDCRKTVRRQPEKDYDLPDEAESIDMPHSIQPRGKCL